MTAFSALARQSRRRLLAMSTLAVAAAASLAAPAQAAGSRPSAGAAASAADARPSGAYITTRDGVQLYYKDWGPRNGQPIVFSHDWPLNSDN